jgi:hypothetical protein
MASAVSISVAGLQNIVAVVLQYWVDAHKHNLDEIGGKSTMPFFHFPSS